MQFRGSSFEKAQIPQWAVDRGAYKIEWRALEDPSSDKYDIELVIRDSKGIPINSFTKEDKDRLITEFGLGYR
jgi:hypothetical protein